MLQLKEEDVQVLQFPSSTKILCESCDGMVLMDSLGALVRRSNFANSYISYNGSSMNTARDMKI